MKSSFVVLVVLAMALVLAFAGVAQAAVSQATIDAIIADAADGTLDDPWTRAEIRAALDYLGANPTAAQYSDVDDVLEDYLASLQDPGAVAGELAYTGAPLVLLLFGGAALAGGGAWMRRRR
jgi:LPXTG-motif cell wall-anchored protein